MRAIILAAGVGQRLGETSGGRPKCLLEFDGISLLRRHITLLVKQGVTDILVVSGYRHDEIKTELDRLGDDFDVETEYNPEYESGSVISLWTARKILASGDDIILMDADVLYHPGILQTLFDTRHRNCFLLDRDFEDGDEPVKICVRGHSIVDFRKHIDKQMRFDFQGESVGFFRFDGETGRRLVQRCSDYINKGQKETPYEEVIRDLLLQTPDAFHYEDISGLAWIEIDFPDDVVRAQNEILKLIKQQQVK